MDWQGHNRWAKKLGISEEVAQSVNRIIDERDSSTLPEEYCNIVSQVARQFQTSEGAKSGNSALHMVISKNVKESHDAGRRKTTRGDIAAEINKKAMREMGEDYLKAWYLHHHLDYLSENKNRGKSVEELLSEHKNQYPKTHSRNIRDFLLEEKNEIRSELDI
ncbi:hypothetical protein [Halorussus pelagicus]|uniref:hypothetical protein n=1 Tax=Halorussus pelagicus TaxID=2505977 RepID=UPI000FFB0644|nr:hypothetical protein [Halorussus pelagicus]